MTINFSTTNLEQSYRALSDSLLINGTAKMYINHLLRGTDRYYHSWRHIAQMYDIHEQLVRLYSSELNFTPEFMSEIYHAIYFHDAIYFPTFKTNEQMSAELWLKLAPHSPEKKHKLFVKNVYNKILRSANHFSNHMYYEPTQWFLGIDLAAGLAGPYAQFCRKSYNIVSEYEPFYDDEQGRKKFLNYVLSQEHIYRHPYLRMEFEEKTRKNIMRFLAENYREPIYQQMNIKDDEEDETERVQNNTIFRHRYI